MIHQTDRNRLETVLAIGLARTRLTNTPTTTQKPKKRAILIPISNKKLFVLGFDQERVVTIVGYDVTYEYIPSYDLGVISDRFRQRAHEFDKFSFVGFASDDTLKTLTQRGKLEMNLPAHLLTDWQRVMGNNTLPHFSYFCLDASDLDRLDREMHEQWRQLSPELRNMLDERNMILVS